MSAYCISSFSSSISVGEMQRVEKMSLDGLIRTDQLIEAFAHAPQRPMVTYTEKSTVGPGPHGLLRYQV
ncbi:hypothetical protein TNCV_92011 [Trichonephila clavipes]|nr:hypothetical protein TNCV_92011 [Trichonephila clavipes]